jgi:hypothetical protein
VRILAMSADRPYAAPGELVTMNVLAVDGRPGQPAPMNVAWLNGVCVNPPGDAFYGCFPALAQTLQPGVDLGAALAPGTSFTFAMPPDVIASHADATGRTGGATPYGLAVVFAVACAGQVRYVPTPPGGSPDAVPFGCFDGARKRLGSDAFVFAYTLVYSFADRTNLNPVIQSVTFGGSPLDPVAGIAVDHGTKSNIDDRPTSPLDVVVPVTSQEVDPEKTPDLSIAEVARRASCSFATAWQAAQDFKLLRASLPGAPLAPAM